MIVVNRDRGQWCLWHNLRVLQGVRGEVLNCYTQVKEARAAQRGAARWVVARWGGGEVRQVLASHALSKTWLI